MSQYGITFPAAVFLYSTHKNKSPNEKDPMAVLEESESLGE